MSQTLAELRQSFAGPGRLDWIGLRPGRKEMLQPVSGVSVTDSGLDGDHGRPGKRAVTLIQAEHLPVIAALCCATALEPARLRRNLVVSRINLNALRGVALQIGEVVLEITVPCAPCSRMEAELGPGGYNAMRGHGGWCAKVIQPGRITLNDRVQPLV